MEPANGETRGGMEKQGTAYDMHSFLRLPFCSLAFAAWYSPTGARLDEPSKRQGCGVSVRQQ